VTLAWRPQQALDPIAQESGSGFRSWTWMMGVKSVRQLLESHGRKIEFSEEQPQAHTKPAIPNAAIISGPILTRATNPAALNMLNMVEVVLEGPVSSADSVV
jgi:hypothetical protein